MCDRSAAVQHSLGSHGVVKRSIICRCSPHTCCKNHQRRGFDLRGSPSEAPPTWGRARKEPRERREIGDEVELFFSIGRNKGVQARDIVGELAKPISLALRLFGNMMGGELLLSVFMGLGVAVLAFTRLPIGFPIHLPFMFLELLTTLVQALVFTLLSTIYISLVLPHSEEAH